MTNLLPKSSTDFERKISTITDKSTNLDIRINTLTTVKNAPKEFLPLLAWQNSVDRWNRNWSEKEKISQIKAAFKIHQKKGTVAALKEITEAFNYSLTVHEWWQETPNNTPGTFQITIETNGNSLTETAYKTLIELIHDAKPLTRELKGIEINVINVEGETNIAAAMYCGEDITIYPKVDDPQSLIYPVFAFYEHEITSIYPK
ncbi:phage tail protein I [Acinetobacter seifertii]|uniref:Phage tail protein I n=1 Tax=Acinetobacter seifertii TaxID=1530123 RepID=A0A7H2V928_9GAMM|nr:phage tail protein I [Acinetobacter seifertii]QNX72861.1 phage tail protein I [Acinetobacter seifertii]